MTLLKEEEAPQFIHFSHDAKTHMPYNGKYYDRLGYSAEISDGSGTLT